MLTRHSEGKAQRVSLDGRRRVFTNKRSASRPCWPPFPALCPGLLRVSSVLLCYTFPVAKVRPRRRDLCSLVSASTATAPGTGREGKSLLSRSVVARSTKETSDGFVGHAVIGSKLAQGFMVFHDTAHHIRPFFRWDAVARLTWT